MPHSFLVMINLLFLSVNSYALEINLEALGIRGGINLEEISIPPAEEIDFYKADVFAVLKLPWRWHYPSGWEVSWRINTAVGILRGAGDSAFVAELGPGIAFRMPSWGIIADIGTGLAALSRQHFGSQNTGGLFQIVGHGGVAFDLGSNFVVGWRFHHMSDANIYGSSSKGVDINFIELGYYF